MQAVSQEEIRANRQMDQIISSLGDLPTSPAVINLAMNMTSDFNADIAGLSKTLSADQTLTAKVLKLSNSSFYGRAQGVATIEEAIVILGFFTLRSLLIATATHSIFHNDRPDSPEHKLWEHSLATGMACRKIAEKTACSKVEEAFIAGLMHDIGKLIFLQKMPEDYTEIIEKVEAGQESFCSLEQDSFGFTHAALGSILLMKWSFPQNLIDAVADHHATERFTSVESDVSLATIINLADMMAKSMGVDFGQKAPENLAETEAAKQLGMDDAMILTIISSLQESFAEEKGLFGG